MSANEGAEPPRGQGIMLNGEPAPQADGRRPSPPPQFPEFKMAEEFLDEECFMRIQNALDVSCAGSGSGGAMWPREIVTATYTKCYTTVYTCSTQKPPHNWSEKLFELVRSRARLVGEKYPAGSGKRALYIKYVAHVFKYVERFYMKRLSLGTWAEVIEKSMERGKRRAATLRRWRLVKYRIVRLERNAMVKASVDQWLIKTKQQDLMDAKSALPHYKRARLV